MFQTLPEYSILDSGAFFGPGSGQAWSPAGKWDSVADQMIDIFTESGHSVFLSENILSSGTMKMETSTTSIHFHSRTPEREDAHQVGHVLQPTNCVCSWRSRRFCARNTAPLLMRTRRATSTQEFYKDRIARRSSCPRW